MFRSPSTSQAIQAYGISASDPNIRLILVQESVSSACKNHTRRCTVMTTGYMLAKSLTLRKTHPSCTTQIQPSPSNSCFHSPYRINQSARFQKTRISSILVCLIPTPSHKSLCPRPSRHRRHAGPHQTPQSPRHHWRIGQGQGACIRLSRSFDLPSCECALCFAAAT